MHPNKQTKKYLLVFTVIPPSGTIQTRKITEINIVHQALASITPPSDGRPGTTSPDACRGLPAGHVLSEELDVGVLTLSL